MKIKLNIKFLSVFYSNHSELGKIFLGKGRGVWVAPGLQPHPQTISDFLMNYYCSAEAMSQKKKHCFIIILA